MKKYIMLLLILFVGTAFSQHGAGAIKLGYFNPSATDGGFIVGYEHSNFVDQNFRIGWSIDWFHVNYVDKKVVGDYSAIDGTNGQINELKAKTNIHEFPVQITASFNIPVAPLASAYIIGGLGAEVMFIDYTNYENTSQNDFKTSFAFNWRIGAGMSYELSKRTDVFAEITYHSSNPTWDYEITDSSGKKRTYERSIDMSGFMMRAGVRFYF